MELVREAALKAQRGKNWGVFQWTVTEGLLRVDVDLGGAQRTLSQPEQLLRHIKATTMAGIYVLLDFHPYLDNPMFVRTIKDIAQDYKKCARTLVLISHEVKLPQELDHLAARFTMQDAQQERAPRPSSCAWRASGRSSKGGMPRDRREGGRKAGRQSRRPAAARRGAAHAPGHLQRRRAHRRRHQAAARGQVPAAESRRHVVVRARYGAVRRSRRPEEPAALDPAAQGGVRRQRARTSTRPRACCC